MNKLLLTILALTISTVSLADYMVKIPLEISQGGSLPNGSIILVNNTEPELTEPEPGSYEIALSMYVQNSGDNVSFNGVSQPGYSNAESSSFNMNTQQFFISIDYEGYFWNNPAFEQYAPNVGGLIQFDGTSSFCQISTVATTGSGTTYSCKNTVAPISDNGILLITFYKRTN